MTASHLQAHATEIREMISPEEGSTLYRIASYERLARLSPKSPISWTAILGDRAISPGMMELSGLALAASMTTLLPLRTP